MNHACLVHRHEPGSPTPEDRLDVLLALEDLRDRSGADAHALAAATGHTVRWAMGQLEALAARGLACYLPSAGGVRISDRVRDLLARLRASHPADVAAALEDLRL